MNDTDIAFLVALVCFWIICGLGYYGSTRPMESGRAKEEQ